MADYIKRIDVMKVCEIYSQQCFILNDSKGQHVADIILDDIIDLEYEDLEEVRHGEWVETKEWYFDEYAQSEYQRKCYECSICKRTELYKEPYCHCGAKMDGGKVE